MADIIKQIKDKSGNNVLPVTHVDAVRNSNGDTLPDILDRDYPTTSKTPVEDSSEVSLCTRGEKYEWNKVGNATDAAGASDITSTFKYLLLNGTTGEFETALKSYVEESVRAALGSLINNLDKGTGLKAVAGIDNNNDLGSATLANLASMLSAKLLGTLNDGGFLYSRDFRVLDNIRDFNKYTATGLYQIQNVVYHANGPSQSGTSIIGWCLVGGWNEARIIQLLVTEYGAWRRHRNQDGWSSWTNLG